MPHNMTPPLALSDPDDAPSSGVELPVMSTSPTPTRPFRRPATRKTPPVEDLALLLVVIGFVMWSVAFAYRMSF